MREFEEYESTAEKDITNAEAVLLSKYFDIYVNHFKPKKNITKEALEYLLKKYWFEGKVASFKPMNNKDIDEVVFSPFNAVTYGMYNTPIQVQLINTRNVKGIFPSGFQKVNKQVVLGYANKSKRPFKIVVLWYVKRLAKLEQLINNNLAIQNMPFLLETNNKNVNKIKKLINRIVSGELVCYTDSDTIDIMQVLQTQAPYLVNEIYRYKQCLENELLTILGVNNIPVEKRERLVTDEVNANNAQIQIHDIMIKESLAELFDRIKEVLNVDIEVTDVYEEIHKSYQASKEGANNESK